MPEQSFTDVIREYLESQFSGGGGGGGGGGDITVDTEMSATSTNPVQNKVITAALALKAALTDIPAMATQTDMSDWTQGKTVDAATLKADFSSAIQRLLSLGYSVADLQTAVSQKPDFADIPTKTSNLTNDSGFQTAAQVQAAIAPLQTKAITDTGGYYSTDTVDGALQEIGAELAGVNTLLGSGVIT